MSLVYRHGDCIHLGDLFIEWINYTSEAYHCVPRRELFITYRTSNFGNSRIGNKSLSHIVGIVDIV